MNNSDQNIQIIFVFKNKSSHKVLRKMEFDFLETNDIKYAGDKEKNKVL